MSFGITEKIKKYIFLDSLLIFVSNTLIKLIRIFPKLLPPDGENILIIAIHKLGDTVFTIPAIRKIQSQSSDRIKIICFEESRLIYSEVLKDIDFVVLKKKDFLFGDRVAKRKVRKIIKGLNPKIIFDLTGVMTSATMIFNSGAKKIIGFNREYFKSIYTNFNYISNIRHSSDIYLQAIDNFFKLVTKIDEKTIDEINIRGNKILIFPFAGWQEKEWGINNFHSLASRIKSDLKIQVIVQPNDLNEDNSKLFENDQIDVVVSESVEDLIRIIKTASVVIGNDSGPVQIASLFGIPTFSIYGPTNPDFHLPLNGKHGYVNKLIKCSPSTGERLCFTNAGRDGCPSNDCLKSLSVGEVEAKIYEFFQYAELNY